MDTTIYFEELTASGADIWAYTSGIGEQLAATINGADIGATLLFVANNIVFSENFSYVYPYESIQLWSFKSKTGEHDLISSGYITGYPSEYLIQNFGGQATYVLDDGKGDDSLELSDGTTSNSVVNANFEIQNVNVVGQLEFFTVPTSTLQSQLWTSNGTAAGTFELDDNVGFYPSLTTNFLNGFEYFNSNDQLWRTNGTTSGTSVVADVPIDGGMVVSNGTLFFGVWDSNGAELMKLDLNGDPVVVADVSEGYAGSYPEDLTSFASNLYFFTFAGDYVNWKGDLWESDGTTAGTRMLVQFSWTGDGPQDLTPDGQNLFFVANDGAHGDELWKLSEGSSTPTMVTDINPSGEGSLTSNLTVVNGLLYFDAFDGTQYNLYATDGTYVDTVASNINQLGVTATTSIKVNDDVRDQGTSDVVLSNGIGMVDWSISDGILTGGYQIGSIGPGYILKGDGDFNDDGTSDLAFQNENSGAVVDWMLNNGQVVEANVIGIAEAGWNVIGIGDFNGDGTSDLLFQNSTSDTVAVWTLQGGVHSGSYNLFAPPAGWSVVGTGDFNADGTTDVLIQNSSTGDVTDWLLKDGQFQASNYLGTMGAGWNVVGTGDFNGDGSSDIVLQNNSTGEVADWLLSDNKVAVVGDLGDAFGFAVVHTGYYHGVGVGGSGTSDILFENNAGVVVDWQVQNNVVVSSERIGVAGAGYIANG